MVLLLRICAVGQYCCLRSVNIKDGLLHFPVDTRFRWQLWSPITCVCCAMASSSISVDAEVGGILLSCALCQETDMSIYVGYQHALDHCSVTPGCYSIQCPFCNIPFPCKAFFILAQLHEQGCPMHSSGDASNIEGISFATMQCATPTRRLVMFDGEEKQDHTWSEQLIENCSRQRGGVYYPAGSAQEETTQSDCSQPAGLKATVEGKSPFHSLTSNIDASPLAAEPAAGKENLEQILDDNVSAISTADWRTSQLVASVDSNLSHRFDAPGGEGIPNNSTQRQAMEAGGADDIAAVYKCEQCDKEFASKEDLSCHRKMRTGRGFAKPAACRVCQKKFHSVRALENHCEQDHNGLAVFACGCGYTTDNRITVSRHKIWCRH